MEPVLDPRTPALIGTGHFCERIEDPDYQVRLPALAAKAAQQALIDFGMKPHILAAAINTIATTRQLENSTPISQAPLGPSNYLPRSIGKRIGADPTRSILEGAGGQRPQHLVNEFARLVAEGHGEFVLFSGAEAISTTRHFPKGPTKPNFNEAVDGPLEDRGFGLAGLMLRQLSEHYIGAPISYALFENARRNKLGYVPDQSRVEMGRLFASFWAAAADNPYSASQIAYSADQTSAHRRRLPA
ncbi:hypothetical protein [Pseudomonas sp. NFX224]|uniref:hypothetical protein n=1 Tax=Pseudomonas sp. NFX224 TaxID=3402862 RepID=UPI003AFB31B5